MSPLTESAGSPSPPGSRAAGWHRRPHDGGLSLPLEEIIPYVDMPERLVVGEPMNLRRRCRFPARPRFTGDLGRRAADQDRGQSAPSGKSRRHRCFRGGRDLSLYDPDRSKAPRARQQRRRMGSIRRRFAGAIETRGRAARRRLALADEPSQVPTLLRQIDDLLKQFPETRWHRYESLADDNVARRQPSRLRQAAHGNCSTERCRDRPRCGRRSTRPRAAANCQARGYLCGASAPPSRLCGCMRPSPSGRPPAPMPITGWRSSGIVAQCRPPDIRRAARRAHGRAGVRSCALCKGGRRRPHGSSRPAHWCSSGRVNRPRCMRCAIGSTRNCRHRSS